MSQIPFEDRTTETPNQTESRELLQAAAIVAAAAHRMCGGDERLAAGVLSAALGFALARTEMTPEAALAVVERHRNQVRRALEEHRDQGGRGDA